MAIATIKERIQAVIDKTIWGVDVAALPYAQARLVVSTRILLALVRELASGQLTLRAMSLVYTTLLSLVPLLALAFSVLKAFGVYGQLEPVLKEFLAPLGSAGEVIIINILGFIENMKVGVLGAIGLGLLLYTVVSLIQKIERAFNYTWHVRQQRRLTERISDYLSVLVFGPVLVFTALGITATMMESTIMQKVLGVTTLGTIYDAAIALLPYVLVIAAFTVVYILIPNTKVRLVPALVGAIIAGITWEASGWAFTSFVVGSTRYTAVYSALATLIVFMIWLYVSWLVMLTGAVIAFYVQNPEYLSARDHRLHLGNMLKERLALGTMFLIGKHYYEKRPAWTIDALARHYRIQADAMEAVVNLLEQNGLIVETSDKPTAYVPASPLETNRIKDVLDVIRAGDRESQKLSGRVVSVPEIGQLFTELDTAIGELLQDKTLKDLVTTGKMIQSDNSQTAKTRDDSQIKGE